MTDTYKLMNRNDICSISGHAMVALSGELRASFHDNETLEDLPNLKQRR